MCRYFRSVLIRSSAVCLLRRLFCSIFRPRDVQIAMANNETQTFRVYNPSSVWRKPLKYATGNARYYSYARVFPVAYFNGFLHTEEGLYTRNVCVSFKPFLTLFDNYFYINPIRKHFQVSRICKELSFLRSLW